MISVNREAMKTVRVILQEADALGVTVERLETAPQLLTWGYKPSEDGAPGSYTRWQALAGLE